LQNEPSKPLKTTARRTPSCTPIRELILAK
jgi:hypothetical protein